MRTNFFACVCAVSGLALVGCPGPEMVTTDAFLNLADSNVRDAGRDARAPGDTGPVDAFAAADTGVMNDTGAMDDTGAMADTGVDAGVADDAFVGIDAFSALDAFSATDAGRDAFIGTDAFTAMDAGRDAPMASDAGRDAFASDANRDAFSGPDAFHGDAFLPACTPATHLVINEIDYDMPGAGDNAEFIELYNPTSAAIDLSTYVVVLVNGATLGSPALQREYGRVALNGMIPAGGYVVLTAPAPAGGSHVVVVPGTARRIEMAGALTDRIQNGEPDGVVLLNAAAVVDTAIYEGTIMSFAPPSGATVTMLSESGSIGADLVADGERSLSRRPSGCDRDMPMTDWYVTVPTPGAAN